MKCHGNHYATRTTPLSRLTNHKTRTGPKHGWVELELRYEDPQAEKVLVAGDFNQWRAGDTRLSRDATGTWKTKLWLAPGRYEYRFIVDSEWRDDPHAPARVPNDFGSSNCVLHVKRAYPAARMDSCLEHAPSQTLSHASTLPQTGDSLMKGSGCTHGVNCSHATEVRGLPPAG